MNSAADTKLKEKAIEWAKHRSPSNTIDMHQTMLRATVDFLTAMEENRPFTSDHLDNLKDEIQHCIEEDPNSSTTKFARAYSLFMKKLTGTVLGMAPQPKEIPIAEAQSRSTEPSVANGEPANKDPANNEPANGQSSVKIEVEDQAIPADSTPASTPSVGCPEQVPTPPIDIPMQPLHTIKEEPKTSEEQIVEISDDEQDVKPTIHRLSDVTQQPVALRSNRAASQPLMSSHSQGLTLPDSARAGPLRNASPVDPVSSHASMPTQPPQNVPQDVKPQQLHNKEHQPPLDPPSNHASIADQPDHKLDLVAQQLILQRMSQERDEEDNPELQPQSIVQQLILMDQQPVQQLQQLQPPLKTQKKESVQQKHAQDVKTKAEEKENQQKVPEPQSKQVSAKRKHANATKKAASQLRKSTSRNRTDNPRGANQSSKKPKGGQIKEPADQNETDKPASSVDDSTAEPRSSETRQAAPRKRTANPAASTEASATTATEPEEPVETEETPLAPKSATRNGITGVDTSSVEASAIEPHSSMQLKPQKSASRKRRHDASSADASATTEPRPKREAAKKSSMMLKDLGENELRGRNGRKSTATSRPSKGGPVEARKAAPLSQDGKKCDKAFCDYRSNDEKQMEQHRHYTHTPHEAAVCGFEKDTKCPYCPMLLADLSEYVSHMEKDHGEYGKAKIHVCSSCSFKTARVHEMLLHWTCMTCDHTLRFDYGVAAVVAKVASAKKQIEDEKMAQKDGIKC